MSYTEGRLEEEEEGERRGGGRRKGGGGGDEVSRKVEEEGGGELEPPRALPSTTDLERDKEGLEVQSKSESERISENDWKERDGEKDVGGGGLKDAIFTVDAWCGLDCGEGICHQVNSSLPRQPKHDDNYKDKDTDKFSPG